MVVIFGAEVSKYRQMFLPKKSLGKDDMLVAYLSISAVCLFFFWLQRFLQRAGAHDVCWCWCMLQKPSNLKDNKTQTDIGGANGRQVLCIFLQNKELKNPIILKISSKSQASKGWKNRYIENKHNLAILRAIGTFLRWWMISRDPFTQTFVKSDLQLYRG